MNSRNLNSLKLSFIASCTLSAVFLQHAAAQGVDQLWATNCQKCHGDQGQGGGAGTSTLLTDELDGIATDRRFFDAVKMGMPDAGMPAFGEALTDAQCWATVNYIRELQGKARRDRAGTPFPKGGREGVGKAKEHSFKIETVIDDGLDVPWAVAFLPDGRMIVTERPGEVRLHSTGAPGGTLGDPIKGTPEVRNRGQGGMMDVAVHPEYATNGWIYLSFSQPVKVENQTRGMTKVVRGKLGGTADAPTWENEETIFEAKPEHALNTDLHFGSRIEFEKSATDGKYYVYWAIGERGRQEMAQDLTRPNGKIYRTWDDGTVPADNPFIATDGAYGAIWSYGHRNPQGLIFGLDGRLWDTEHAPRGGDEVNLVLKARNYGWPIVSYGINYSGTPFVTPWPSGSLADGGDDDIVMPIDRWMPSTGACGLDVVKGDEFPNWKGDLVAGGLSGQNVDRIRTKDGALVEREELIRGIGRVRDVVTGPTGAIYVVLNDPDDVVRMVREEGDIGDRR